MTVTVPDCDLASLTPPKATARRCVVTLAAGQEGRELHAVTGPFLGRYARRLRADYRVIAVEDGGPFPLVWKWAAANYLKVYDRVFYVDADALVRPTCPDVFDVVPEFCVGMVDESSDFRGKSPDGGGWWQRQVEDMQRQQGLSLVEHPHAWNAGVWVAGHGHRAAFGPPKPPAVLTFCGEQHWLNDRLLRLGVPVYAMPNEFNARWMWEGEGVFDPRNHVVHLSGLKPHAERVRRLRGEAARW